MSFIKKLEEVNKNISDENRKKCDSKDFIIKFLSSEKQLLCGIEMIIQAIAGASVQISVESRRNDKLITLSEDAAGHEMVLFLQSVML